jgi:hypothetical protein
LAFSFLVDSIRLSFTLKAGVFLLAKHAMLIERAAKFAMAIGDKRFLVFTRQTSVPTVTSLAVRIEQTACRTLPILKERLLADAARAGVSIIALIAVVYGIGA